MNCGSGGTSTGRPNDSSASVASAGLWATTPPVITSVPSHGVHLDDPLHDRAERALDDVLHLLARADLLEDLRRGEHGAEAAQRRLPWWSARPGRSVRRQGRSSRWAISSRNAPVPAAHLRFILKLECGGPGRRDGSPCCPGRRCRSRSSRGGSGRKRLCRGRRSRSSCRRPRARCRGRSRSTADRGSAARPVRRRPGPRPGSGPRVWA